MKLPQKILNYIIILFVIAFTTLCGLQIKNLHFDYDFEALFPNDNHELELYKKHRSVFEWDNEFVLLGVEHKAGIFHKDFLKKVDSLSKELRLLPYINQVTSPTSIKSTLVSGIFPVQKRLMHIDDEELYKDDSIAIYNNPQLIGSFFPTDAKSISLYLKTDENLSKKKSDSLASSIERTVRRFQFDDVHFVGRVFAQKTYISILKKEFSTFLIVSIILIVLFLWLSFRSLYGIFMPIIIVSVSVFWTLGIMAITGQTLNIMTVMLPIMIFVAGMSDVTHFLTKYDDELLHGNDKEVIYPMILREVGFPTFLTLITTVIGFLTLLFSGIKPISDFGLYTSIGITIAFCLTYTLLPALLYFFTPTIKLRKRTHSAFMQSIMQKLFFKIFRHQKIILTTTLLIVVLSLIGIYKIRVNNLLLDDLSDKVKLKQDFLFFDKHYSGVRPLELSIEIRNPNKTAWDYDVMQQLNGIDNFLKQEYKAGFIYSPAMITKAVYKELYNDSLINGFPTSSEYIGIRQQLLQYKKHKELSRVITTDGKHARISAKMNDVGSRTVNQHNEKLQEYVNTHINSNDIDIKITGAAHLIDRNNKYMVTNMTEGFLFSIFIIALLTFILHRSWKMTLVFILPNILPLLIIAGIMGFGNIELKTSTSLIFGIAFGIATDDTIHFISRLKVELGYQKSLMYAFKRTYFETGKPIFLTTLILIAGFMSLMISEFQSTFYFGFLICITIIIAVLADIFLLPILLFWLFGRSKIKE